MKTKGNYWFPAKRYGWGWGLPRRWQGWVVYASFAALLLAGGLALEPLAFAGFSVFCGLLLVAVCCWKGEPPRWRWGGK